MKNKWKKEPKCKCGCKHKKAETILNKTLDDIFGDILALATDGSTVSIKELLEGTSDKKLAESNLKKATELMNKEIAKQMEKVSKGERKILCDSPVKVNDENVEIKGNQLLDESNNLKQMKTREWDMCKQKCMEQNNVKIISKEEIKPIIKIVKNKFGDKFIEQFKLK